MYVVCCHVATVFIKYKVCVHLVEMTMKGHVQVQCQSEKDPEQSSGSTHTHFLVFYDKLLQVAHRSCSSNYVQWVWSLQ